MATSRHLYPTLFFFVYSLNNHIRDYYILFKSFKSFFPPLMRQPKKMTNYGNIYGGFRK